MEQKKKKKLFLNVFFILVCSCSFAQWYNPDKVNKKALQINESAYEAAQNGNYAGAITL